MKMMKGNTKNSCMFEGKKLLYVKITSDCPCKCDHCIEKNCMATGSNIDKVISNTLLNTDDDATIFILGGEPFVAPYLHEYINRIKIGKRKVYITTSGITLGALSDTEKEVIKKIDWLCISINHYNESKNALVYGNRISFDGIKNAIKYCREQNVKVRINANLIKGRIETLDDCIRTYKLVNDWGADVLRFNELQHCDATKFVDVRSIINEMGNLRDMQQYAYIKNEALKNHKLLLNDELKRICAHQHDSFIEGCSTIIGESITGLAIELKETCNCADNVKCYNGSLYYPIVINLNKVIYPNGTDSNLWLYNGGQVVDDKLGHCFF